MCKHLFLFTFAFFVAVHSSQLKDFAFRHFILDHVVFSYIYECNGQKEFIINQKIFGKPDKCGIIHINDVQYFPMPFFDIFKDGSEFPTIIQKLGIKEFYKIINNSIIYFSPQN